MQWGSGSGDGKNHEHRKYKCLIPFMRCSSTTARGSVAEFFSTPWSNSCHCCRAFAVESGRGLHSCQFLLLLLRWTLYQQLLEFPRCRQLWWITVTKNWTQVVWGCDRHSVQTFVLQYCSTKNVAFSWILFSIFFLVGEVQQSAIARVWKQPELVEIQFGPWLFFSRIETKKAKKMKARHKYGFTHIIYRMRNRTLFATAAWQIWFYSFTLIWLVILMIYFVCLFYIMSCVYINWCTLQYSYSVNVHN